MDIATTDADGHFRFQDLDIGRYYVAREVFDKANEVYNDISCDPCEVTTGTPIDLSPDLVTVEPIEFRLNDRTGIIGRAIDAGTLVDIPSGTARLFDANSGSVVATSHFGQGSFSIRDIRPGNYYLHISSPIHKDVLYQNLNCNLPLDNCAIDQADIIPISNSQQLNVGDITLTRLGTISGQLFDVSAEQSAFLNSDRVELWDSTGTKLDSAQVFADGYRFLGLQDGSYFLLTNTTAYFDQLYGDGECIEGLFIDCHFTQATPVEIQDGNMVANIDFELRRMPRIFGQVSDAISGVPISATGDVALVTSDGHVISSVRTHSGSFVFIGVPPGHYFVVAEASEFQVTAFPNIGCQGQIRRGLSCPLALAELQLLEASDIGPLDIRLLRDQGLSGIVTSLETGEGLPGVALDVWDDQKRFHRTFATNADGSFSFSLNSFGSQIYFLSTDNGLGLVDQVYPSILCLNGPAITGQCSLNNAAPLVVSRETSIPNFLDIKLGIDNDTIFRSGFEL